MEQSLSSFVTHSLYKLLKELQPEQAAETTSEINMPRA